MFCCVCTRSGCSRRENDGGGRRSPRACEQWHPDKNADNLEEATERFQEITEAHSTLSDPTERAWYDNHREQILRGSAAGEEDDYIGIDLFKFFCRSCYKGYTDEEGGFYAIYNAVFEVIDELEAEEVEDHQPAPTVMGGRDTVNLSSRLPGGRT